MVDTPNALKYSESHEWVRVEEGGLARIGITQHAQHLLGDMVFIELPEMESDVKAGEECAVVESVKAASDIYSPVSGAIVEVNEELLDSPALVNSDPYGAGWLFLVRLKDELELGELLDAEAYDALITDEDE